MSWIVKEFFRLIKQRSTLKFSRAYQAQGAREMEKFFLTFPAAKTNILRSPFDT